MQNYKKIAIWLLKAGLSGIVSLYILSAFSILYKYNGAHLASPMGATDYTWEPGQLQTSSMEGFSWLRMDEKGYNNAYKHNPVGENVDILLMGSSHMEAFYVGKKENAGYLMNEKMPDLYTYNIGAAGHEIYSCINNIDAALDTFNPTSYVVVETDTVELEAESIRQVINGRYPRIKSYDSGLMYTLQKKIPSIKLLFKELRDWWEKDQALSDDPVEEPQDYTSSDYTVMLDDFLKIAGQAAEDHRVKAIIFYQPPTRINEKGNYYDSTEPEAKTAFASACERNGICFVDMGEPFRELYESEHVLAHGFINTRVGQGHLNKYGHEAVAATLADVIGRMEDAHKAEK